MKKFSIVLLLLMLAMPLTVTAQSIDDVQEGFQSFADGTAGVLPLMTTLGLNWNDAYTGGFPHFGLGVTMGAVIIPLDAFEDIMDVVGAGGDLDALSSVGGVPLPMYTVDGRIGIPILPIDVGVKVGLLDTRDLMDSADFFADYKMFGFDVRYAVMEDNLLLPDISVGIGYTYLNGSISMPISGSDQEVTFATGDVVALSESEMLFDWTANVLDFKAQASKKLLMLNLSAGLGYSYGFSNAGGGIKAGDVTLNDAPTNNDELAALTELAGVTVNTDGVLVNSDNNGGSFRVFGGAGLNLFLLKIDFGLVYGLGSDTLGMSTNFRVQF